MRQLLALFFCVVLAGCQGDSGGGAPSTSTGGSSPSPAGSPAAPAGTPLVAAVYTADNDLDGIHELYAIDTIGGILSLSHGVGDGHHVTSFALSPDERQVVFAVDNGAGSGLYLAPVNENAPVRLSPPGALTVEEFAWAPDGSRIAYRASASPAQLYLVRPDGTGHVSLTGGVAEVGSRVRWSFDGAWLAFLWDREVAGQRELHVVRPDGSGLRRITTTAADASAPRFVHYSWSPTANCIVFRSDLDVAGEPELHVVDVDAGTPPVRLSTQTGTTGAVEPDQWAWSPDGSALVYRHRDALSNLRALYMVSKQGGDARQVSGAVVGSVSIYEWSPDSTRVAFRDGESLHVADGASPPVELARSAGIGRFEWAPAGDELAYLAGGLIPKELWTVDMQGGAPTFVGEEVMAFAWEPPPQLAQVTSLLRVVMTTNAFGLTLPIAGVWDGLAVTPLTVLPQYTNRAAVRVVGGRAYIEAQVFIGGNTFVHSLSAEDILLLTVGLNAVIKPLSRPPTAPAFDGFIQALNVNLAADGGSFIPVIWYVHGNAEAKAVSIAEWNESFRGQVPPNTYVSVGIVPVGSKLPLNVKLKEVGFAAIAELKLVPEAVAVKVFSRFLRWRASGFIDPGNGTDEQTVSSEPRPQRGLVLFAPTLFATPDLTLLSPGVLDEEWEDVLVIAEQGDALFVVSDGATGWVRKNEVIFEPRPALIPGIAFGSPTLPVRPTELIDLTPVAFVTVVDERELEGTPYVRVYIDDPLDGSDLLWVPASDVQVVTDEKRTIEATPFFATSDLVDARGTIPVGDPVFVIESITLESGKVATRVSWFDSVFEVFCTGWVDDDALTGAE